MISTQFKRIKAVNIKTEMNLGVGRIQFGFKN